MFPTLTTQPKPFLKWAGGKSQLIEQMHDFLPKRLINGSIKRYIEPFIGGGAVFFYICYQYKINELFIFDVNPELVIAYKTIQHNVDDLIVLLLNMENQFLSLTQNGRSEYFYEIREQFNKQRKNTDFQSYNVEWLERTAQIIFLNKTCYNGLFRVNSQGKFNVPIGNYKKPSICNPENLRATAKALQETQIYQGDFTECEKFVDEDSFVYCDPPYRPISNTSKFTSYAQQSFDDFEQLRLRDFFKKLDKKGALLLLSNSDPKNENINDDFFEEAYQGYRIEKIKAARSINSNASKRKPINELLIMNY